MNGPRDDVAYPHAWALEDPGDGDAPIIPPQDTDGDPWEERR